MDISNFLDQITLFFDFYQKRFFEILPLIKIIAGVFSGLFFILVVWLTIKTHVVSVKIREVAEAITKSSVPKRKAVKEWATIMARLMRGGESDLKLAIIEADKLFDDTVKRMGHAGETMAERLKKITPAQLSNIEHIWDAHKVRNNIVHNPAYSLSRTDAEIVIGIYEKALREWGLID